MRVSRQIAALTLAMSVFGVSARSDVLTVGTTLNRMAVYYGDLNLNTEHGARIMMQRIKRGAIKACGGQRSFSAYTGGRDNSYYECRDTAILKTVNKLAAPLVTLLYSETAGRTSNSRLSVALGARG